MLPEGLAIEEWLQWGRDQLIAELSVVEHSHRGARRFNGAAIN